jgi:rSAM/selenodomain-associated transferase 1
MARRVIIVFAKAPRMGSVKTRLAKGIGQAAALGFYRGCLARTIRTCERIQGAETVIWTAPDNAVRGQYFNNRISVEAQGRGDIGVRMARALDHYREADRILIGGDIPGVTPNILNAAYGKLKANDAVYGPAEDGGFWLIGLRRGHRPRRLFNGVGWSRSDTLDSAVRSHGTHTTIAFCKTLNDIDDLDDYLHLTSV